MEIKIGSQDVLKTINIIAWIIFIGLCIESGGIIFNAFYTVFINPIGAKNFWMKADLSDVYALDKGYFIVVIVLMSIVSLLKALMFYLIIKLFHNPDFHFTQPFNRILDKFISYLAYLSFGIGLFSIWGIRYCDWLTLKEISVPSSQSLRMAGGDVWLFMCAILFVIAFIVKRGVEIQTENELTV
ncbi:hypothetical protein [Sediminibacterium sp. TEGAF015]|uniref:hypothetical protein n=1 Tax=Sediminibacterium sp. TEGAF015 TaxID=575378 RepID=UPI0022002A85|nr:hypothetical protein [Sediminibacterium sp. TEGAF015]BDQ11929.1 hypothetical protein TEGAF0_11460 [Sediminibacterium sp. TEGAF015]